MQSVHIILYNLSKCQINIYKLLKILLMKNKFAERFKECLKTNNISQTQFAKRIGVSISLINKFCLGTREPNLDLLLTICNEIGESADYLLGIKEL